MIPPALLRRLWPLVALAAVYFISGELGLRLAFVNESVTAVWPPTGIALAALVLFGYGLWPAILVSAFLVNFTITGAVATSLGIAVGNTLEALAGAYLVNRFAHGRRAFDHARDIFAFTLLAGLASTMISATIGVVSISLGGFARWSDFGLVWLTWWLGDVAGALVVAPAALLWGKSPRVKWDRTRLIEATALLLCVIVVTLCAFGGVFPSLKNYPLEFLCVPFFVWVAFRFGARETATAILVLAVIAMWGTLHGYGPFVRGDRNESVLLLQAYMVVTSVTSLALAALVAERRQVEERLRQLAVSDPLTGLANHRQLIYAVDAEIKRSHRTQRAFAVVLLDLDGLKVINDRYGHLVGSLAVCRVAEAMFGSCRGVDTAARFGGDEFALVLPETDFAAAWHVARRVAQRVAQDGEQPTLSVSLGVAMYPQDGATTDALLAAADRSLYENKALAHRAAPATL
jgi:diguanylate cyclase (GGDEF)-like protein